MGCCECFPLLAQYGVLGISRGFTTNGFTLRRSETLVGFFLQNTAQVGSDSPHDILIKMVKIQTVKKE